jgi:hypothetical protein
MLGEHPITPVLAGHRPRCSQGVRPRQAGAADHKPGHPPGSWSHSREDFCLCWSGNRLRPIFLVRENENAIVFRVRQRHPPGPDQQHRRDRRPADPGGLAGQRYPYRGGRTPHPSRSKTSTPRGQPTTEVLATSRAGLAKLLARRSTSPLRSESVKGRYSRTEGDTGV